MIHFMKMNEAYLLFMENRKTYCSDSTLRNYSFTLSYFFSFCSSDLSVPYESLDVEMVDLRLLNRYSIYLKDKPKNNKKGTTISSRTRKDYLKDAATFYNFLYDYDYVSVNPAGKLRFPRVDQAVVVPLTSSEVTKIDMCYNDNTFLGSRNLAIIHCLVDEGMRSGEVRRLRLSDIDFMKKCIVIRKTKNQKSRVLPLSSKLGAMLSNYLCYRPMSDTDYVFISREGVPFSSSAIKCIFTRLKEHSGIERLHPHLLRHTFASSFILGGGSLELLRIYMGHDDISTTQGYLHVFDNVRFMDDIYQIDECFLKKFY